MEPGYNTLIKSQGKRKRANVDPLTKIDAIALGMSKTDMYPAASFEILKTGENAIRPTRNANIFQTLKHKFYRKGSNRWIERNTFRIDKLGEVQGIPFEAVRLRKAGLLKTKPRKKKPTVKTTKGKKRMVNKKKSTTKQGREKNIFERFGV